MVAGLTGVVELYTLTHAALAKTAEIKFVLNSINIFCMNKPSNI